MFMNSQIGRKANSSGGSAPVPEGDLETSGSSEYVDIMEDDVSFLDVDGQQYGRGVHSGRRRGRPRGRGSRGRGSRGRGRGRINFVYQILRREKELEQNSDVNDLVKVRSQYLLMKMVFNNFRVCWKSQNGNTKKLYIPRFGLSQHWL
jgi:hypothetical protein